MKYIPRVKTILFSILACTLIVIWFILIHLLLHESSFFKTLNKKILKVYSGQISSYLLTQTEYKQTIPGLLYNINNNNIENISQSIEFSQLGELLTNWNPNNIDPNKWTESKCHPNNNYCIKRFDFNNPFDLKLAKRFRQFELPFILYNVSILNNAIENYFTIDKLLEYYKDDNIIMEESVSNHFTYYKSPKKKDHVYDNWIPPQQLVQTTFNDFLSLVDQAEKNGPIITNTSLQYYTISAEEGLHMSWLRKALPMFTNKESFFIVDPKGFKGINCRFGMKGIVSTAHYDSGRNFVAMIRGRKRYVLLPPSECSSLPLFPPGHPSARHSNIDWSDPNILFTHLNLYNSKAVEVVVSSGEFLYIPGYWFHYIISQDASIQCNARSGDSKYGKSDIENCGFYSTKKESTKHNKNNKHHKDNHENDDINSINVKKKLRKRHKKNKD